MSRTIILPGILIVLLLAIMHPGADSSAAGLTWQRYAGNPVLTNSASGWDSRFISDPAVVWDGAEFKMYYNAWGSTLAAIGVATSPDGINWTKQQDVNPVLRLTPGAWDWTGVYMPTVIKDGATYRLWYWAGNPDFAIGYATSPDGFAWTKYPEPVLRPTAGGWDNYIHLPWVLQDGSGYKMYYIGAGQYEGSQTGLGLATSTDAVHWTKHPTGPLFTMTAGWPGYGPSVVLRDGVYHLWYSDGTTIKHATSPDGIAWTPDQDLGLGLWPPAEDCRVTGPSLLFDGQDLRMWYNLGCWENAIGYATTGTPPTPTSTPTGTATATATGTATATATATATPIRDRYVRLPLVIFNVPPPTPTPTPTATATAIPSGWRTVFSDGFEGAFPGPWRVMKGDGTEWQDYFWGKRTCRPFSGNNSAWAMGGGAIGSGTGCYANYANWAYSWMEYGPFSLADATQAAELRFKLWLNTERGFDGLCYGASVDGQQFTAYCVSGTSPGWVDRVLDLTHLGDLGNLIGQPNVWISIFFLSDGTTTLPEGAYVDDVVVRKCVTGYCPAGTSAAAASDLVEWQGTFTVPQP